MRSIPGVRPAEEAGGHDAGNPHSTVWAASPGMCASLTRPRHRRREDRQSPRRRPMTHHQNTGDNVTTRAQKSRASLAIPDPPGRPGPARRHRRGPGADRAVARRRRRAPPHGSRCRRSPSRRPSARRRCRARRWRSRRSAPRELDKAHVQTIADIVHLVPSFQATTEGDHGVITMTMRGIGNDSAKTEYADPEVALFVNGIYAPRAEGAAVAAVRHGKHRSAARPARHAVGPQFHRRRGQHADGQGRTRRATSATSKAAWAATTATARAPRSTSR